MPGRRAIRGYPGYTAAGLIAVCILGVFLAASLVLLRPRYLYYKGANQFNMGSHAQAISFFEQAHAAIPDFLRSTSLTAADRLRLETHHGMALFEAGIEAWKTGGPTRQVHALFIRSREHLEQAAALEPGFYITAYWRARTEHALERIHPWQFPATPNPFNSDAFYLKASALRPAGISVRQAHARYLFETGQTDRIPALVTTLLEIYPPSYDSLKREPYYTPSLWPHMVQGLENAFKNQVRPRDALNRLARLYQDQDNPGAAIDFLEKYLAYDPGSNTSKDFFLLGTLCLQDGRHEKSFEAFVNAIAAADDREAYLKRIYNHFRSLKLFTRFLSFTQHIEDKGLAVPGLDLVKVRCYFDMDQVFLAKELLAQVVRFNPTGPAFFLRATIAQKEKDWDAMEIFSQKATRQDPYNPGYHFLFAQALNQRKKYANAENAVTLAIRHAPRESTGYYNFRAWTRWHQEKFKEAALDWEKAAALNPDNPDFAKRAAQAREKIGLVPVTGN